MTTIWGIHNDQPHLDLVGNGFISVGWDEVGDIRLIGNDKEALKACLTSVYPDGKSGAIPVWAGVLLRFVYEMQPGDLVIYPYKPDATLNFGRITGDYEFHADQKLQPNRRKVEWLKTGVPRALFSQSARYEVGSAVTLFKVKHNADEFRAFIDSGETSPVGPVEPTPAGDGTGATTPASTDEATKAAEDEPNAERIETYTRDFITETLLKKLEGAQFEHFVSALLTAMGYRTRVTQASGDGGVDVIAHKDPLGLEPPIIKVQVKSTEGSVGDPIASALYGKVAPGEFGLLVTLGRFTPQAIAFAKSKSNLRLIDGADLVALVFQHYEGFDSLYKGLLPLRRVYVPESIEDEGDE